jgi:transmembrane sensor
MENEYLLAKWLNDELTLEELEEFRLTPEYADYEKIKRYSAQLTTPQFDQESQLDVILNTPKKVIKSTPVYKLWIVRVAAILVLGLGIFQLKNLINFTETTQGNNTQFYLPDNSLVVLNSGSEIKYKKWNWNNQRELSLSGEAFFKVAKGKKFDVITPSGKISVLGTQFNVKNRKERLEVECFEGKVWVTTPHQSVVISKGEMVFLQNDIPLKASANPTLKPSWMNNEIRFVSSSYEAILYELEQNYNLKITSKAQPNSANFTGYLPKNNIEKALEIISKLYNLEYKIVDKNNIEIAQK